MRILIIADGRSPITRSWLKMLKGLEHQVSLISSFPCQPLPGLELQRVIPLAFSGFSGSQVAASKRPGQGWVSRLRPTLLRLRALAAPLTLSKYTRQYLKILDEVKPDLVHALRIPFEGMLTAATPAGIPVIISIWGNDLTFHAKTSFLMAHHTRRALKRADGLLADAERDLHLAAQWGLNASVPRMVLPGNGGLDLKEFVQITKPSKRLPFMLPEDRPIVINPRGFRPGSVHQDVFFRCLPAVIEAIPSVLILCPAMQSQAQAVQWVRKGHLQEHVRLLPYLDQSVLWQLFSKASVYVSLSSHDGTPNTFLEALACGCFPIVGDIESLREWLVQGQNGLLVDPFSTETAAKAIIEALRNADLRNQALKINWQLVKERAEINAVRERAVEFYEHFI